MGKFYAKTGCVHRPSRGVFIRAFTLWKVWYDRQNTCNVLSVFLHAGVSEWTRYEARELEGEEAY